MQKWVRERRKFIGKKMIAFNFKSFMISENLTVEELAKLLGYTIDGTMTMLNRGTVKANKLLTIKQTYPDAERYEVKKTK